MAHHAGSWPHPVETATNPQKPLPAAQIGAAGSTCGTTAATWWPWAASATPIASTSMLGLTPPAGGGGGGGARMQCWGGGGPIWRAWLRCHMWCMASGLHLEHLRADSVAQCPLIAIKGWLARGGGNRERSATHRMPARPALRGDVQRFDTP